MAKFLWGQALIFAPFATYRVAEFWTIFEYQSAHSTEVFPMIGQYFVQIWAHLGENSKSASQKTAYVVKLLKKICDSPTFFLSQRIAQHWVGISESMIHAFEAEA